MHLATIMFLLNILLVFFYFSKKKKEYPLLTLHYFEICSLEKNTKVNIKRRKVVR